MKKPYDWEEACNQLADEKQEIRDILDNLVTLWEFEAPLEDLESAMLKARALLNSTVVDD